VPSPRQDRPQIWCEKSGAPRTAFDAHTYNKAFRLLAARPRMIEPIEPVFGEKLPHAPVQDQREGRVAAWIKAAPAT
jgi:hypothetical protein